MQCLIVETLWLLIQLSNHKFAHCAFNTLSRDFAPRNLPALYPLSPLSQFWGNAWALSDPGFSMSLPRQESVSYPAFLCHSESSKYNLNSLEVCNILGGTPCIWYLIQEYFISRNCLKKNTNLCFISAKS